MGAFQNAINTTVNPLDEVVYIVDQTGTLLAHPDPQLVAQHVNVGDRNVMKRGLDQDSFIRSWHDGNMWIGSTSVITPTKWVVVTEVPLLRVYGPYLGLLIIRLLLLILIFSVAARVFLNQLQFSLVEPLIRLSRNADALADGNYQALETNHHDDLHYFEINNLLADFQKMSRSIIAREKLLKENEEQYRRLLDYSPNAILLHENSTIMYANAAAVELYKAERASDFVGRSMLELVHPDSRPMVQSRMQKIADSEQVLPMVEQMQVRFDESLFHAEVITSSIFFAGAYVAQTIVRDITQRKNEENALRYRATHDPLTNLPNRFLFQDRLEHALKKSRRNKTLGAVLYLDFDGFKSINDALGHAVGDQVLQYVGNALRGALWEDDTVARLGGDEFVVLLDVLHTSDEAENVAENILRAFSKPYLVAGQEIMISFSIGVSVFPDDGMDVNVLLQSSDAAMYRAKQEGKRRIKYYAPHMREDALERMHIQTYLMHALDNDQFFLQYQPQVESQSGKLVGVEALIRWRHPTLGLVSPAKFIPIAEETGLVLPIGEWVLRTACEQLKQWQAYNLQVAVNLSNLQLKQPQIIKSIQDALNDFDLSPHLLEIELTENIVFQDADRSFEDLYKLKRLGVSLAMDDFGSGFSTLSHLAHIPFDMIKIDQRLVSNIQNPKDAAVVSGIIAICKNLGLDVVAEGVETREQLDYCTTKGCKYFQGWYYSKAVDPAEITNFLLHGTPWKSGVP